MTDRARWGLLALAMVLLFGGVVGALVHEDTDGPPDRSALSTSTTAGSSGASETSTSTTGTTTAGSATTTASTTTPSTLTTPSTPTTPSTQVPGSGSESGLGSSGTGEIAAGTGPTPQTGLPGWVVAAGTVALLLGMATRRLATA